ncbi:leucine-rich repeat domain-containing protein, partial [Nonomuraea sp. RK-328]|nr:leucine-rich repeat domain-containing protein [Nonomuraea sp. RK-328]
VADVLASRDWAATGRLDLSGLRLRELPDVFTADMAIHRLDLSGNRLTALPPSLFRLGGLEELDLGHNRLRVLPPEIGALGRLTRLDVSENRLTALPAELAGCAALQELRLFGNLLTGLEPSAELPALTLLDVSANRLRALPGIARGLVVLDLSGNQLSELPGELRELRRLRRLDLSGNRLTDVEALRGLPLEELHLDGNALATWPYTVAALPNLRRFSALGNPAGDPTGRTTRIHEAVRAHTTGHADPAKQYFDAATLTFAFSLAVSGSTAVVALVEQYYKRFRGVNAVVTLADGSRIELSGLSRKSALRMVRESQETATRRALVNVRSTNDSAEWRWAEQYVVQTVARLQQVDLVPDNGPVIHFQQVNINPEVTMGDRINITGNQQAVINVKATLTNVTQAIGAAQALDDDTRAELNRLVEQLHAELAELPPEQAEDAEAVAEATADLVDKATKDKPNKKLVGAAGSQLRDLVDGLGAVAPVALGIIDLVTKIVGG